MFFNANVLPRIIIGADVWGESGIMTGVYLRWYSSLFALVLVALCDRLCLLLVCKGRYGFFGRVSSPDSWDPSRIFTE